MIEDHHITRLEKGAMANLEVEGDQNPAVFEHVQAVDTGRQARP
jgi:hypothetical protein